MLKLFKRNQLPAPLAVGVDPLKIRNLLDDPRLQAVMNTCPTAADASLPELGRIDRPPDAIVNPMRERVGLAVSDLAFHAVVERARRAQGLVAFGPPLVGDVE